MGQERCDDMRYDGKWQSRERRIENGNIIIPFQRVIIVRDHTMVGCPCLNSLNYDGGRSSMGSLVGMGGYVCWWTPILPWARWAALITLRIILDPAPSPSAFSVRPDLIYIIHVSLMGRVDCGGLLQTIDYCKDVIGVLKQFVHYPGQSRIK